MLHTAWVCSIFQKEGTEMQEQVKATFLVNAAVLLEFRGTKLLIDGIYDENGHCFSNLSERQWEKLKAGEGEFAGIEYLLFTHEHGDHFSPAEGGGISGVPAAEGDFHAERRLCCLAGVAKKAEGDGDSVCSAASGIMQENRFSPGAGDSYSCLPDQTSG